MASDSVCFSLHLAERAAVWPPASTRPLQVELVSRRSQARTTTADGAGKNELLGRGESEAFLCRPTLHSSRR
jgi:hypothetical protein